MAQRRGDARERTGGKGGANAKGTGNGKSENGKNGGAKDGGNGARQSGNVGHVGEALQSRSARSEQGNQGRNAGTGAREGQDRQSVAGVRGAHGKKRHIERYEHTDKKRANNPPVGLVNADTEPPIPTHKPYDYIEPVPSVKPGKELDYDPHLDPQLVWAGKKEHASFEVPTVSLHVHETIDPRTIIEAVRKRNGDGYSFQPSLFERPEEKLPLHDAIEFYKHAHGWSNRLIAGDSLLVMNSLLEKEGMAGQVRMVYIDPPYGVDYASNFQPFTGNRTVKDRDADLTQEPETIKAFRDTWELGIHSYLTFLRDRLLLSRELLSVSGSIFVQIGDQNVHVVRSVLDEIFQPQNMMAQIIFRKKMMPLSKKAGCESMTDYILWYVKSKPDAEKRIRQLFLDQVTQGDSSWDFVAMPDGTRRALSRAEIGDHGLLPKGRRIYSTISMKPREYREGQDFNFDFDGSTYPPPGGRIDATPDGKHCWSTTPEGMRKLAELRRLQPSGETLRYVLFHDDYPVVRLTGSWNDTAPAVDMRYVVETAPLVVRRCMLMATDPGDLVLDPTCGSGTTAYVAEEWGRRWITCDTSRVAITLAKQRLMGAEFDYYELAYPEEGVGSGFRYRKVPHITLGSLANEEPAGEETLFDDPFIDGKRARVTGPFTVEAVPAPTVRSLEDIEVGDGSSKKQESLADFRDAEAPLLDASVARKGPTLRHTEWRDELLKTGLRGKGGHHIDFSRVEPLAGTRWLHADAETKGAKPERVVISFGPEHSLLDSIQVEEAWKEARTLSPRPAIILFAAFEFDPEAAKQIDSLTKEKTGMTFLTAQMNTDLLTEDLKKKRASNQGFWLVGRPDVELRRARSEETVGTKRDYAVAALPQNDKRGEAGLYVVEVRGFDYYDTRTGTIESGDTSKIAMWLLDTDYDGRSLYPRQVFFPMADDDEGWAKLARNLKAEIDPELIEKYRGTVSLPFEPGPHKQVAVKVIDDRGIESMKVVDVK
jgi:adenine-specific DNA-methyltransferase